MALLADITAFEKQFNVQLPQAYRDFLRGDNPDPFLYDGDFHWNLAVFQGPPETASNLNLPPALNIPYAFEGQTVPFHEAARLVAAVSQQNGWPLTVDERNPFNAGITPASWQDLMDSITIGERRHVDWLLVHSPTTGTLRTLRVERYSHQSKLVSLSARGSLEPDLTELLRRTAEYIAGEKKKKELAAKKRAARLAATQPKILALPASPANVAAFEKEHAIRFGAAYAAFLGTWKGGAISHAGDITLYTLPQLERPLPGQKKLKQFQSMRFFADLVEQVTGDAGVDVLHTSRKLLPEDLSNAIAVGDSNGDPIFIDPDNDNRLLILHHDGMDLEYVTKDFKKWIAPAASKKSK